MRKSLFDPYSHENVRYRFVFGIQNSFASLDSKNIEDGRGHVLQCRLPKIVQRVAIWSCYEYAFEKDSSVVVHPQIQLGANNSNAKSVGESVLHVGSEQSQWVGEKGKGVQKLTYTMPRYVGLAGPSLSAQMSNLALCGTLLCPNSNMALVFRSIL